MKREAELKGLFTARLKLELPNFVVLLQGTVGAPDRAIVGNGVTTFWEMKHATPDFDSPGIQELMCQRLEVRGHCRYVIWQETGNGYRQRTTVATPYAVANRNGWFVESEAWCLGYDMAWLVRQVRKAHKL